MDLVHTETECRVNGHLYFLSTRMNLNRMQTKHSNRTSGVSKNENDDTASHLIFNISRYHMS